MQKLTLLLSRLNTSLALQLFQLMRQGSIILGAIVLVKSSLSSDQVGDYEMLMYVSYLLTFFWVSGSIQGLLSYFPSVKEDEKPHLFFQSSALFLLIGAVLGCGLFLFPSKVLSVLVQRDDIPYFSLFTIFLITNIPASLQEYFYLLQGRAKAIVAYGMVTATLQLLAICVPAVLEISFRWSFVALAGLGVIKCVWLMLFVRRYGQPSSSFTYARAWWVITWPLMLYALLAVLNQSVGPWMVGYFYDGDATKFAVFRYGARELPLLGALTGALSSALIPVIAAKLSGGMQRLKRESLRLYHLLFPLGIVLMLSSDWWFVRVFSVDYEASIVLFNTFLLLLPIHLLFSRTVLVAQQDTKYIPFFALGSFVAHVILCLLLAPIWGMQGIALGSVLAYTIEKIGLTYYLYRKHNIGWSKYADLKWWWGYTIATVIVYYWT